MIDKIDKLIDELPGGWKPMDSAPKDGTWIDISTSNLGRVPCAWQDISTKQWPYMPNRGVYDWVSYQGLLGQADEAVEWLPLPTEDTIMMTREELREFANKVREVE